MARKRVYIAPFLPDGSAYGAYVEVTKYVDLSSLGTIQKKLDISDFDIGVYTNSAVSLTLNNESGLFSDVGSELTMFEFKRGDSLVKITWDQSDYDYFAGLSTSYDILGHEVTVYEGLLNDDSTVMQIINQQITFDVLGYESIFDRTLSPDYVATPPSALDCKTILETLIAQAVSGTTVPILTLSIPDLNPNNNALLSNVTWTVGKTVREAINAILTVSNSVLFMNGTVPVVSARVETALSLYNFYGPGSELGPENIIDIQDISSGLNRTFNFVTGTNNATSTVIQATDGSSATRYGFRKKELSIDAAVGDPAYQSIANSIRDEFGVPKQEFKISTPLNYAVLGLPLLAKTTIDFPQVNITTENLPYYGVAQYGVDMYPLTLSSFLIQPSEPYKIIGMELDLVKNNAIFNLRRTG